MTSHNKQAVETEARAGAGSRVPVAVHRHGVPTLWSNHELRFAFAKDADAALQSALHLAQAIGYTGCPSGYCSPLFAALLARGLILTILW